MAVFSRQWFAPRLADDRAVDVEVVPMSKKDLDKIRQQIVETALAPKVDQAASDAFLGQQTQVVDNQTKAREVAPFRDGKTGGEPGKKEKLRLGSLGVPMNFAPMGHLGPGETASNSDYLRNVKPGAQTMLNTKEFAFFSFYQRVRRQLEQFWEPGLRKKLKAFYERGRQLATDQEHSTRVLVIMNREGTITRVQVESTSGLLDLDQAAVDAFNKAGPFPNPPQGMIDKDGSVRVEWEFVLRT